VTERSLRAHRATGVVSLFAAAVLVCAVPALAAAAEHPAGGSHPAASGYRFDARTAYVTVSSAEVVPISLATNAVGTPIRVPEVIDDPFVSQAAPSPDGRTVYEVGLTGGVGATVTSIDTATNTAGPTTTIKQAEPQYFAVAPDGKSAYLSTTEGLFRISTATNTVSKPFKCSKFGCGAMAFTPGGKRLYVINRGALHGGKSLTVIRTASDTALARIRLPGNSPGISFNIGITPDGKTAYVVDGTFEAKSGANTVVPIDLATSTPLTPIKISAPGLADGLVIARGGRTAYVLSSRAVTVIDTASNQADATIELPRSAGYAYSLALAPDGTMLYVFTPRGVVPIRTATGAVLPRIDVPKLCPSAAAAVTPGGGTIYVGACITRTHVVRGHRLTEIVGGGVVPISTAANKAGRFINLGGEPSAITFAR
jgi:DNA-binding beta-propeller fold protein YncE